MIIFLKSFLSLIRVQHYIKSIFIFAPLFFSGKIVEADLLLSSFIAFLAFSFAASSIYVLNDYLDVEHDRLHPKKKNRPLASGFLSKKQGVVIMALLFSLSCILLSFLSMKSTLIVMTYVLLNVAYSFYLKHIAILDVTVIAIGFVLRLLLGAVATEISLSSWIVVMTFLLAMFLALAKRRDDVLIYQKTGKRMRKVIDGYNLRLLDTAMAIMASVVIVSYIAYTTSVEVMNRLGSEYLYITCLFVIVGIMRYLQIIYVYFDSGSPTKILLKDFFIQIVIIGWVAAFILLIYA